MAIRWSGNSQLQLPELVDVFKLSRFGAMGPKYMLYVHLSVCIGFFALPPQGSHPVPQTAAERVARHLQVGLEGSQKVDVAVLLFFFRLPSWNFQDPNITELCSLWQDCEVIGWAELCERKKLTAGSCFQLQCLGLQGIWRMRCLRVGCGLDMVGKGWEKGLCLGQRCFEIRCFVFGLSCWRQALFGSGNSEVSVALLSHSSEACRVLQLYDLF